VQFCIHRNKINVSSLYCLFPRLSSFPLHSTVMAFHALSAHQLYWNLASLWWSILLICDRSPRKFWKGRNWSFTNGTVMLNFCLKIPGRSWMSLARYDSISDSPCFCFSFIWSVHLLCCAVQHWTRKDRNLCLKEAGKCFQHMGKMVRLIISWAIMRGWLLTHVTMFSGFVLQDRDKG
jgi:hypothetical protein